MSFLDSLFGQGGIVPGATAQGSLGGQDAGQMQSAPQMSQPGLLAGLTAPDPNTGASKLGEAGAMMRDAPAPAAAQPQPPADPTQLMLQHMRMARMAAMRAAMGGGGGGGGYS